jgi:LmbE family N-acetylglucosaminyl deacetylase
VLARYRIEFMVGRERRMKRETVMGQAVVKAGLMLALVGAGASVSVSLASSQERAPSRTLLAVFAHPDDEQVVSPMLARYAREGVRVVLAIATDGQKGVREHAGIAAGEPLATARAAEARCACERLGIEPPILIGIEDGALQANENKTTAIARVTKIVNEVKPDAIVTWGPDGVTGHTDHRLISNIVTEVIQRGAKGATSNLFYAGFPAERLAALKEGGAAAGTTPPFSPAVVAERFLPVRISYTEADATAAAESLACHKTQYTPAEMAMMSGLARTMEDGAVHLRPWFVDPGPMTDVFKK